MTVYVDRSDPRTLHPLHTVLLAGTIPLFLGALLSDWAYWFSYQVQWTNFASWLIAGGLIFTGLALVCAVIGLFSSDRAPALIVYPVLLMTTLVLGFINALVHAKDAWASMPTGLILSGVVFVLALLATWIRLSSARRGAFK